MLKKLKPALRLAAILGCLWLIWGLNGKQAHAASQVQRADFEVQPIQTPQQVDKSQNYFDIRLKPGQTQVLRMRVQNFTDQPITVKSTLENGMTQEGGDMKFQTSANGLDPSLTHPLTTLATITKADREIHLDPQSATIVTATVKMPTETVKGVIAGGWRFKELMAPGKTQGQSVASNYAYLTSINLRGQPYHVYPELKYAKAQPMLADGHPALGVYLRNTQPMFIKNVTFKAVVTKQGLFKSKRVFEKSRSSIAPNSAVVLPISWEYRTLRPGKYHVDVKVTGQNFWNQLPMTWHFKQTFKVGQSAVQAVNKKAMKRPLNRWAIVTAISGFGLIGVSYGLWGVLKAGRRLER